MIGVVGLSHRTAPVEVRERFAFTPERTAELLARLQEAGTVLEAVLLTTCNRTELYLRGRREPDPLEAASAQLLLHAGLPADSAAAPLYQHRELDAVRHLLRVASSLDSMVVGEAQIQGQVRDAYEQAVSLAGEQRLVGPVLARLFETALATGGRVRSETALGTGSASVPSAAVELAKKIFGNLAGRRALVLGAGEMSELALQCFAAEGVRNVVVASRTEERARALAERAGAEAVGADDLAKWLPRVDIIAAATAAPHAVLTRELFDRALPSGPDRPLLIVDIALPRDVDPAIGELENVFLYDLDDLRQIVEAARERRRGEIEAAEVIVGEGADAFWAWYRSLEVVPIIRALRDRAEAVRQAEFDKTIRRLQHLSAEDREAVETLTRQLLNKVLHHPTARLREAAANGQGVRMLDAARYLFELQPDPESQEE